MAGGDDGKAGEGIPDLHDEPPGDSRELSGSEAGTLRDTRLAHFIRMLSDDDAVSRWKAAEALGRLEDPAAVEELISTLWDDDARVRLKAAWALGRIGDPRAYAPLRRLYRMENEGVQDIIQEALETIRLGMSRQEPG
jgi:HEAT repeat protein